MEPPDFLKVNFDMEIREKLAMHDSSDIPPVYFLLLVLSKNLVLISFSILGSYLSCK
jgi:hypothetical protein